MDTLKDCPLSVISRELAYSLAAARTARENGLPEVAARFYVEGSSTGWNLYEDLSPGAHDVLFGRTKTELWDLMHAFAEGARYAGRVVNGR